MSLDVYLELDRDHDGPPREAILIRRHGALVEITREEWDKLHPGDEPMMKTLVGKAVRVFRGNVEHNLTGMAAAAGLYVPIWRPEQRGITHAEELIEPLAAGLECLKDDADVFKQYGDYASFVHFVASYLAACQAYPEAQVKVSS
jgi:hypothetical protein